jgi:hypothetical protein
MSAPDKSAIPTDATAVSAITRAQKASRPWWGTGDIFSKAHLDIFVKRAQWLMTPQLTTADTFNRHVARHVFPRKELHQQQTGLSAPVIQPYVAPRGTILARSNKNFAKSKQASDKSISQLKYIGSRNGFRSAP